MLQEVKDMVIHSLISKDQPAPAKDVWMLPEDLILPIRTQQELLELDGRLDDDSFHELLVRKADVIVKAMIEMIICNNLGEF